MARLWRSRSRLDVAITSPLQSIRLDSASSTSLAAASEYEDFKLNDRDTARRCADHSVSLIPMVAESFGVWGQLAQPAIKVLAHALASKQGTDVSNALLYIHHGLSSRLWRANARSVLARVGGDEMVARTAPRAMARDLFLTAG